MYLRDSVLIISHNLLHLLSGHHGVCADHLALLHVVKHGHVPLFLLTARTNEGGQLEYLPHVVMQLDRLHAAAAIGVCAGPAPLRPDAILAEKAVAGGAL